MMGQQAPTEPLPYYFRLEDQIPEDPLLIGPRYRFRIRARTVARCLQYDWPPPIHRPGSPLRPFAVGLFVRQPRWLLASMSKLSFYR